ncbi:MAG: hypothetical protein ACK5C5_03015, partial [Bacteroidota bacterium]
LRFAYSATERKAGEKNINGGFDALNCVSLTQPPKRMSKLKRLISVSSNGLFINELCFAGCTKKDLAICIY